MSYRSRSPSRTPSQSRSRSPAPRSPTTSTKISRETTVPFLLHLTYRLSAYTSLTDYPLPLPHSSDPSKRSPIPTHLQIYTWQSCTLRELAHLLTSALPGIMPDPAIGTRLSFRLVYPDTSAAMRGGGGRLGGEEGRARYTCREVGSVVVSALEGSNGTGEEHNGGDWMLNGEDSEKTLQDARFVIGDFVDCAIFPPLSDGSVVPQRSVGRGGMNGYGARGVGRGGFGAGRGSAPVPVGEWRRGERLPVEGGYGRGGGGGGGYGRGGRRGGY